MDRELAAALAGELPDTADVQAEDATPPTWSCPSEPDAGAEFVVPGGRLTVLLMPANAAMAFGPPASTATADAPTSDGRHVIVLSVASRTGGNIPYESELSRFATNIAGDY